MVKIRLRRMGAKKNPFYRIIVADSKSPRDGRCIEEIGTYDPLPRPPVIAVEKERAQYWISQGAQPTDTVRRLLRGAGVSGIAAGAAAPAAAAAAAAAEEEKTPPASETEEVAADE